jgi:hypothetical protein
MESNQRSRQKKASTRPAGSLRLFRAAHIAKAKPSFTPPHGPLFCQAFTHFLGFYLV